MLDIELSENGTNLSQGEKQLICIARVLIKKPKILLLAESTATLDEETEINVMNVMWNELKDSTIIMISHKEGVLSMFNRVFQVRSHSVEERNDLIEQNRLCRFVVQCQNARSRSDNRF